jgi:Cytosine/uracil/thiamine/allantoin permeases
MVDTIAAFFGPIFGVIIIDYYISKKRTIINKDIFSSNADGSYYYTSGWHIKAVYSIIIGFIFAASTIWNPNLNFIQTYSWLIGSFISSLTYYLLTN